MLNRPLPALPGDLVLLTGRVTLGVILFAHGWHKVMIDGIAGTSGQFERLGIPLAIFSASFAACVEFVGGVLLVVGAFTTTVVALDMVVMVGAAVFVHLTHGVVDNGGLELVSVIVAAELLLVARGPGRFSVDGWIQHRRHRDGPGRRTTVLGDRAGSRGGGRARVVDSGPVAAPPLLGGVAFLGRPVPGTPTTTQGWVSGSWADGFGETPMSSASRAVTELLPVTAPESPQRHADPRSDNGGQWGVWTPTGDAVVGIDRPGATPGGGAGGTADAGRDGPYREASGPRDAGPSGNPGPVDDAAGLVEEAGQNRAAGPMAGAGPAVVPVTRAGEPRPAGGRLGVLDGVTAVAGPGLSRPGGPHGHGPAGRAAPAGPAAGSGTALRTPPPADPALVAPRRPAVAAVEPVGHASVSDPTAGEVPVPRAGRALPIATPRAQGASPAPLPLAGGTARAVPVSPAAAAPAPDDAAASGSPGAAGTASVAPRPAATAPAQYRRPAPRPAVGSVAEIFRPVTEGVLPPAASYPHPGPSPDPVSRSVRAYAPQPAAADGPTVDRPVRAGGPMTPVMPVGGATHDAAVGQSGGQARPVGPSPREVVPTSAVPVMLPAMPPGLHPPGLHPVAQHPVAQHPVARSRPAEHRPAPVAEQPAPSGAAVRSRPSPRPAAGGPSS